jgi:hypothetical protein
MIILGGNIYWDAARTQLTFLLAFSRTGDTLTNRDKVTHAGSAQTQAAGLDEPGYLLTRTLLTGNLVAPCQPTGSWQHLEALVAGLRRCARCTVGCAVSTWTTMIRCRAALMRWTSPPALEQTIRQRTDYIVVSAST